MSRRYPRLPLVDFQEYTIYPGPQKHDMKMIKKVEKIPGIPMSYYVGAFAIPGQTAYGGFKAFAEEKAKTVRAARLSALK